MCKTKSKVLTILTMLLLPFAANADLIRLDAESTSPSIYSDFFIIFDDTGDGLLQWDEIVDFSGLIYLPVPLTLDFVERVPEISGISTRSWDPSIYENPLNIWLISNSYGSWHASYPDDFFTYSLASVPEPGTLALLVIGLFGMSLARSRRKL